jgi:energy-coupling factor transporter ATP-binding protein EcfA2
MGMEAGEADTRLVRVLQELGLQAYMDVSPYRLSLGEKRRLNVASVAVYEPEVYLLDEPFVGQDPGNVEAIVSALRTRLKEGASTLVVSHDPDFIEENCDRVVFLSGGRVLHQGSSREVFQKLAEEGEAIYLPAGWTD